jgi:SRSO17 transposase
MIERAIAADVPFAWVAADSVYGVGEIEMMLRRQAKGYVLGVSGAHHFNSWIGKPEVGGTAKEIAKELDESVPGSVSQPAPARRAAALRLGLLRTR